MVDGLALVGPQTDADLERLCQTLLVYYSGGNVTSEAVDGIRPDINRLRGVGSWRDNSPLGLKYSAVWAVASSRERNLADLDNWQYGVVTAFQIINVGDAKDQSLIALIRENASKYGADLYEMNDCR